MVASFSLLGGETEGREKNTVRFNKEQKRTKGWGARAIAADHKKEKKKEKKRREPQITPLQNCFQRCWWKTAQNIVLSGKKLQLIKFEGEWRSRRDQDLCCSTCSSSRTRKQRVQYSTAEGPKKCTRKKCSDPRTQKCEGPRRMDRCPRRRPTPTDRV